MLVYSLEMICIVAFALSGVLVESNRGKDIVSIMMLGWITAFGGGTLRDLILSAEKIFWISDPSYFWTALSSAIIGFSPSPIPVKTAYVSVSMGLVTAIFGGVLLPILCA